MWQCDSVVVCGRVCASVCGTALCVAVYCMSVEMFVVFVAACGGVWCDRICGGVCVVCVVCME